MKKIKISEINLNAKTLDGKEGIYYDHKRFGLGTTLTGASSIPDLNANDILSGLYTFPSSALNSPIPDKNGFVLHIIINANSQSQFVIGQNSKYIAYRNCFNSVWSSWNVI